MVILRRRDTLIFIDFIKQHIKIVAIVLIAIFAAIGLYLGVSHIMTPQKEDTSKKPHSIETKTTQKLSTSIQYVPKALVQNESGAWVQEDTDVELNQAKPQVSVKVNGKTTKFDLQSNETQKFQNGKLQVDQTNTINFDVKVPDRHELNVYGYAKASSSGSQPQSGIGVEKHNGRFHYGVEKDLTGSDKDTRAFARYDLVKLYTN